MSGWTKDQLVAVASAEELRIAGRRSDGTLRKPTIVWAVRTGDDVFVRSVNGPGAAWYRSVENTAHIWAGGVEADVEVRHVENEDDAVDAAYWAKYGRYPGPTKSITSAAARSTTLKLVPKA